MRNTLGITTAILSMAIMMGSAEAGRWSRDRIIEQPKPAAKASPAPPVPGVPDATLQYRQEYARVTAMLAKNPNAFGGFNTSNTLAELRSQVDKNIRTRHARELAKAATAREIAQIKAVHATFWDGLAARRELRTKFTDEQNIVHSLMMIMTTKAKIK